MNIRAALIFAAACVYAWPSDRVTAGFGHVPPLHYEGAQGAATGFVVDVINEAGRREQISIGWLLVAGSHDIEPALMDGRIDLFPSAIVTDTRRARFWVSEPWWTEDLSILVRADVSLDQPLKWHNRRDVLAYQTNVPIASSLTPGATFELLDQRQPLGQL